jgi:hypothetical protein
MKNLIKLIFMPLVAIFLFYGCKKDLITSTIKSAASNTRTTGSKMLLVPGRGYVPAEQVHFIEPGNHLELKNGHYLKVETSSKKVVEDYGVIITSKITNVSGAQTRSLIKPTSLSVVNNENWVVFSQWIGTGYPAPNYFSTTWAVPSYPTAYNKQTLFIFNGLQDTSLTRILQPVLQYGPSAAGGGNNWGITNWYVAGSFVAIQQPLITVTPTDSVTGVMTYTGQQSGTNSYNYTSSFSNYSNSLSVVDGNSAPNPNTKPQIYPSIPELTSAFETLEVYSSGSSSPPPSVVSDYPTDKFVAMRKIALGTATGDPSIPWTAVNYNPSFGQKAIVVNNSNPGGEVDLYFHDLPIISYSPSSVIATIGTAITGLSPTNSGSTPSSYSISPALPTGLNFSTGTGVISGTPTASLPQTLYTITASNSAGSGTYSILLTVYSFIFNASTSDTQSIYFDISINGGSFSTTYVIGGEVTSAARATGTLLSNSTIVINIPDAGGILPSSASIYGLGAPIYGVLSGRNFTFTGVNLTSATSCILILD